MPKSSVERQRDVEVLIQQSEKPLAYAKDLMQEAARIREEAARIQQSMGQQAKDNQ